MADLKITDLSAAGALTGVELVELVQGGVNVKSTAQAVANLATGSVWAPAGTTATVGTTSTGSWAFTTNVTEVIFTGLAGCDEVLLDVLDITADGSTSRDVQVSIDNGSNWLAGTSYDYVSDLGVKTQAAAIGLHTTNNASARSGSLHFLTWNLTTPKLVHNIARTTNPFNRIPTANALNAIRIFPGAGNFTGGSIRVYAR